MMEKIISFDFDMTLFNYFDWKIVPSALRAIELLRKKHKVVIATGRDMGDLASKTYLNQIVPDGVIHANGSRVEAGGNVIYRSSIAREHMDALIRRAIEMNWCVGAIADGVYYCTNPAALERSIALSGKRPLYRLENIASFPEDVFTALAVMDSAGVVDEIERQFPMFHYLRFSGKDGADIVPPDMSKKTGMERLLEFWDYDFSRVVAFGDSYNDVALIREAAIGIAMGNADTIVKAVADYVTDSIESDGVWNACVHFQWFTGDIPAAAESRV